MSLVVSEALRKASAWVPDQNIGSLIISTFFKQNKLVPIRSGLTFDLVHVAEADRGSMRQTPRSRNMISFRKAMQHHFFN